MTPSRLTNRSLEPAALARSLAWLRICAVIGQSATVALVAGWMGVPLPLPGLIAGIVVLGLFSIAVLWRLKQPWPISTREIVAHVAVDTAVLGWLLFLTGGANNPFIGLLLMPITLSAAALRERPVLLVAILSGGTYLALLRWYVPLPSVLHAMPAEGFNLHVAGMAVSFAISAALLGGFIGRLAGALRAQQAQNQRIRESALRDEGILAIATQAAGAAHELNTPLSTMRTLLGELQREHRDAELAADLQLLSEQVQRCSDSLRELVAAGKAQLGGCTERLTLSAFINDCLARFRLLRPEINVTPSLPESADLMLHVPTDLRHALLNLLNNAADASVQNDSLNVGLSVSCDAGELSLRIRDYGTGLPREAVAMGMAFSSTKHSGLGIGLALADATAERLGGQLRLDRAPDLGLTTNLQLPLERLLQRDAVA